VAAGAVSLSLVVPLGKPPWEICKLTIEPLMYSLFVAFTDIALSPEAFKERALYWAGQYPVAAYYEPNTGSNEYRYGGFDNFLAVSTDAGNLVDPARAFDSLKEIWPQDNKLLCGLLSYDLKNQVEELASTNPDLVAFPLMYFFRPEIHLAFEPQGFTLLSQSDNCRETIKQILAIKPDKVAGIKDIEIKQRVSRPAYIAAVNGIREEILNGEIYEMNFCLEFYAQASVLSPIPVFLALNRMSPMPFGGFFKVRDQYLLCASPERFIRKAGQVLISQPIKGTIRRGINPAEDAQLREKLSRDEKELAENMMIMDLVRNDLSKSSVTGTVKVEEMFGIYGFRQVYQMMTTVTGLIRPDCHPVEAIKNAFPMGSMTGAPKIRALELIDQYESTRRGLYSGSMGYLKADGDFDFNVVIRSLQYNAATGYLSFMVGSAITYDSLPEQEYEECLLKAQAIMRVLLGQ
jgi:para-aminobenzoate synthetase component 1